MCPSATATSAKECVAQAKQTYGRQVSAATGNSDCQKCLCVRGRERREREMVSIVGGVGYDKRNAFQMP